MLLFLIVLTYVIYDTDRRTICLVRMVLVLRSHSDSYVTGNQGLNLLKSLDADGLSKEEVNDVVTF